MYLFFTSRWVPKKWLMESLHTKVESTIHWDSFITSSLSTLNILQKRNRMKPHENKILSKVWFFTSYSESQLGSVVSERVNTYVFLHEPISLFGRGLLVLGGGWRCLLDLVRVSLIVRKEPLVLSSLVLLLLLIIQLNLLHLNFVLVASRQPIGLGVSLGLRRAY